MTAPLHHAASVVAGDFHPVSDSGVSEAVAGEAVCLAVIELGDFAGDLALAAYNVGEGAVSSFMRGKPLVLRDGRIGECSRCCNRRHSALSGDA